MKRHKLKICIGGMLCLENGERFSHTGEKGLVGETTSIQGSNLTISPPKVNKFFSF